MIDCGNVAFDQVLVAEVHSPDAAFHGVDVVGQHSLKNFIKTEARQSAACKKF